MNSAKTRCCLLTAILILAACQTSGEGPYGPATKSELTATELDEVRGILNKATGQAGIRMDSTAFNRSHILVLQPAIARTPQGRIATGRTATRPETFHLLTNGRSCVIEHIRTGERYPVSFQCSAAD